MRLKQRNSVDFPQPDGPMIAVTWFAVKHQVDVFERLQLAVEKVQPGLTSPLCDSLPLVPAATFDV